MPLIVVTSRPLRHNPSNPKLEDILARAGIDLSADSQMTYVVDTATMSPVPPILEYLTHCHQLRNNRPQTIHNKAHSLHSFFTYLRSRVLDYNDCRLSDLVDYRQHLLSRVSPLTKNKLSPGTINGRLQCALDFCKYHNSGQFTDHFQRGIRSSRRGRHAPNADPGLKLMIRTPSLVAQHVNEDDLRSIFDVLKHTSQASGHRDWLIAAFCVSTGSRLGECLGLTSARVHEAQSRTVGGPTTTITLDVTKGGDVRHVTVDRRLIADIGQYIAGPRAAAIARSGRAQQRWIATDRVFVNGPDCAATSSGTPFTARRMQAAFTRAQLTCGVTREKQQLDPKTGRFAGWKVTNRYTVHHLRHTYAVQAWKAYSMLPEADRWLAIQTQLGHRSHSTTADTYLRSVNSGEDARELVVSYFKQLLDGAT